MYKVELSEYSRMKMGDTQFRAQKNGQGGPLRYQSMQQRWQNYCEESGVKCTCVSYVILTLPN